jgi:hypothetical protein
MASWEQFAAAEPAMAELGRRLLSEHGLAYLATVRRDGAPRLHPVSPFLAAGMLIVMTPPSSPKAGDQLRDGRYAMHFLPGKDDDEFAIRGRVRAITEAAERARVRAEGPHFVSDDDHYFEYDIEEAATAYWVNVGQPDTYPVRSRWRAPAREGPSDAAR